MIWNGQLKREVPEGWEVKPLANFAEKITKGSTPTSIGCSFCDEGIRFIKVENIIDGAILIGSNPSFISTDTHMKMSRSALKESDLLVTIAGRLGDVTIVPRNILPANTNQAVGIVRLKYEYKPVASYLKMYLSTNQMKIKMQNLNAQSIQKNLNLDNVGKVDILYDEHTISSFSECANTILETQSRKREEIDVLAKQRGLLLPLLMNGQVEVAG